MTVRYANDLMLTDLACRIKALQKSMDAHLTDGNLDSAFLRAMTMQETIEGLMWRLNDIKYGRV